MLSSHIHKALSQGFKYIFSIITKTSDSSLKENQEFANILQKEKTTIIKQLYYVKNINDFLEILIRA